MIAIEILHNQQIRRHFDSGFYFFLVMSVVIALLSSSSRLHVAGAVQKSIRTFKASSNNDLIHAMSLKQMPMWEYHNHTFQPTDEHVPNDKHVFDLLRVVVMHRHGDRSQIHKGMGPQLPDDDHLRQFWKSRLPNEHWETVLESVANIEMHHNQEGHIQVPDRNLTPFDRIYKGQDLAKYPYGMLTTRGVHQLVDVGKMLRRRYGEFILNDGENASYVDTSNLYVRSTNYCRTHLSVRSLLFGLLGGEVSSEGPILQSEVNPVTIVTRPRAKETMFPAPDESCSALMHHTKRVCKEDMLSSTVEGYHEIKEAIEGYLQAKSKFENEIRFEIEKRNCDTAVEETQCPIHELDVVNWPDIKEVLTCHWVHESGMLPKHLDESVVSKSTEIASRIWHEKYSDPVLNKYALGRFIHEFTSDMLNGISADVPVNAPSDSVSNKNPHAKMIVYSGHDATIFSVLLALGFDSAFWPPYASYISFEIAKLRNMANPYDETPTPVPVSKLLCRILFNDKVLVPTFLSLDGWVSLTDVLQRLESASITHEEYSNDCKHEHS